MADKDQTEKQLIRELKALRQRVAELEKENFEERQVLEALRISEEKYRLVVESAGEAILIAQDGMIKFVNPTTLDMLGYSEELVTSRPFMEFVHPEDREMILDRHTRRLKGEEPPRVYAFRVVTKDGAVKWVELSTVPVFWNERLATLNFLADITKRKLAEEELSRYRDHLEDLVNERTANLIELNEQLKREISERKRAEEELRRARDELEDRVEERTAELRVVNDQLLREIAEHKHTQEALMQSDEQLRFLSFRLLEAQEEERKRIAIELHDSIGQSLAAVKFSVEHFLQGGTIGNSEVLAKQLEVLVPMIQGAIEEARRIYTGLRPSMLDDLGIHATVNWFCREFQKTFPHIRLHEQIEVEENEIPEPIKIVIFRVLQEALNNVAKYSEAEWVKVRLSKTARKIELSVKDNGKGFDLREAVSKSTHEKGFGLTGMQERTELSDGVFLVESSIGEGTAIRASWPRKT